MLYVARFWARDFLDRAYEKKVELRAVSDFQAGIKARGIAEADSMKLISVGKA